MAERYNIVDEGNTSGTADTTVAQLGALTGAGFAMSVYEVIAAIKAAANDTRHVLDLMGSSTVITAGTAATPQPLIATNQAAVTGWSTLPTSGTRLTFPFLRLTFNARATVRWAAIDPDSRITIRAGGGAAGSMNVDNRNSGAAAIATLAEVRFAEG